MAKDHQRRFSFCGGHLALDFVNTLGWRLSESGQEVLKSPSDLLAWCRQADILSAQRAAALRRKVRGSRVLGDDLLAQSLEVRELIYRMVEALLHDRKPAPKDVSAFNKLLRSLDSALEWTGNRYAWKRTTRAADSREILEPIIRAAAELLTSDLAVKVAQCQDDRGCGWLFLDRSRSKPRRWCSMQDCGNRDKVRRYYQRLSES